MRFSNWQNKATAIWLVVIALVAILMATLWWQKKIHIQTDIFQLLPQISQQQQVLDSYQQVNAQLNNKVFVMLQTANEQQLQQATAVFNEEVKKASQLWQPLQPTLNLEKFAQTLFEYRTGLLSQDDQQLLQQQDYQSFTEKSMLQLLSPGMPISAEMLEKDPLLLFPRYLMEKSQQQQQDMSIEQGWATVHQVLDNGQVQHSRLIVLELLKSPYQVDYQEQTQQWMSSVKQKMAALQVQSQWTGTLLFASYGTQSAKQEISTIGVGSSLGLMLLVLFGFRSVRPLFTEFIAISSASLMAFAFTHWLFGEVHLMTLVFGASLIGVCVDFSFYFMAMQAVQRDRDGFSILKPLLPSLFMGLMTSVIAYFFLSFTPFPAFKQISVFSMVGLLSAWITSILLLPRLPALNAQPAIDRLRVFWRLREAIVHSNTRRYVLIAVVCVFSAVGLSQLQFNDDIRQLQSSDPALKQQDQNIRQTFAQQQGNDYFIVTGETPEQLLHNEQALLQQLAKLQQQQKLDQVQALGQWLDPIQQQQNVELLQQIPQKILIDYAVTMGLSQQSVLNWQNTLAQQPQLSMAQLAQHPLVQLALSNNTRIVLLQGIHDVDALKKLSTPQQYLMQPVTTLSEQFARHRQHAQWLLIAAIVTLGIILGALYGRRAILDLTLPVSLALACTFALQAFLGLELNLFSVMATFLILGLGVDYAIFYHHAEDYSHVVSMALFLCMMSTLLGFGLLALSATYAIFCFGLTVLCGVILAFVFATCLTRSQVVIVTK